MAYINSYKLVSKDADIQKHECSGHEWTQVLCYDNTSELITLQASVSSAETELKQWEKLW